MLISCVFIHIKMPKLLNSYEIGKSTLEELPIAALTEIQTGSPPQIANEISGTRCHEMERYVGFLLQMIVWMSGIGTLIFTNPGCALDALFQVNGFAHYLGIQIKTTRRQTTQKGSPCWVFGDIRNPNYDGSIMIFRSIQDQVMWIIPYRVFMERNWSDPLRIFNGPIASKYWNKYRVSTADVIPILSRYFRTAPDNGPVSTIDYNYAMRPVSESYQKEYENRQRLVGILTFYLAILDNLTYDIIWQNLRIQEKPAYSIGETQFELLVRLSRNNHVVYTQTDFDMLLIHCNHPYNQYFYFVPINILCDKGFIRTEISQGKESLYVHPPGTQKSGRERDEWANDYRHEYLEPNLEAKLINLCRSWGLLQ